MCRPACDGGRRCPNAHGNSRRSADRARYAARKAADLPTTNKTSRPDPAASASGGGGGGVELDWPAAKQRIAELRTEIDDLLTRAENKASGAHSQAFHDLQDELEDAGMDRAAARDEAIEQLGYPTGSGHEERRAAEALVQEAGRLVDTEVLSRVPPVPMRPPADVLASLQAAYQEADTDRTRLRRLLVTATDEINKRSRGEDYDPEIAVHQGDLQEAFEASTQRFIEIADRRDAAMTQDGRGEWRQAQAQAARDVLGEIRDMGDRVGHRFHETAQKPATAAINEAFENFPSDWVKNSSEHPSTIAARHTQGRAHYAHSRTVEVKESTTGPSVNHHHRCLNLEELKEVAAQTQVGDKREVWVNGKLRKRKVISVDANEETLEVSIAFDPGKVSRVARRDVTSVVTTDKSPRVTVHEMSHRMEYTNRRLVDMEETFYLRRTEGEELVRYAPGGPDEYVRPDGFVDEYIGKDYDHRAFEVLSMGMEAVFTGSRGALLGVDTETADLDHRAFILGLAATV